MRDPHLLRNIWATRVVETQIGEKIAEGRQFKRGTEASRLVTFGSVTAFSLYVKSYLTGNKSGNLLCSMMLLPSVDII